MISRITLAYSDVQFSTIIITKHTKKVESMAPSKEKIKLIETILKEAQTLHFLDKNFKPTALNILQR